MHSRNVFLIKVLESFRELTFFFNVGYISKLEKMIFSKKLLQESTHENLQVINSQD